MGLELQVCVCVYTHVRIHMYSDPVNSTNTDANLFPCSQAPRPAQPPISGKTLFPVALAVLPRLLPSGWSVVPDTGAGGGQGQAAHSRLALVHAAVAFQDELGCVGRSGRGGAGVGC